MNEHNHTAITFEPTTSDDLDALVDIRIAAMRESLVRVGRFDPDRARERFQSGFSAADTRFILHDACRVGFLVVKTKEDHLLLDHRYILPQHQGKASAAQYWKPFSVRLILPACHCMLSH